MRSRSQNEAVLNLDDPRFRTISREQYEAEFHKPAPADLTLPVKTWLPVGSFLGDVIRQLPSDNLLGVPPLDPDGRPFLTMRYIVSTEAFRVNFAPLTAHPSQSIEPFPIVNPPVWAEFVHDWFPGAKNCWVDSRIVPHAPVSSDKVYALLVKIADKLGVVV